MTRGPTFGPGAWPKLEGSAEVLEMHVLPGHFRPSIRSRVGCSGTCPYVPPSQSVGSEVGTPCTCIHLRLLGVAEHKCIWLYLFPSGLPFITKSRFIPPPPSRPVLSSSSLRPHLKSKTPPLRAKIFFLPPPDLFFLGAIPVALLFL